MTKIYDILITIFIFLFIFNISFTFFVFGTGKLPLVYGLFLFFIYLLLKRRILFVDNRDFVYALKFCLFLLIASSLFPLLHKTYDFSVPYAYLLFIIEHLFGSMVIIYLLRKQKEITIYNILQRILLVIFIQACIVLLMLVSEDIKFFIYSIIKDGDELYRLGLRYEGIRGLGLASNTTYELSVVLSIGLMIVPVLLQKTNNIKEIIRLVMMYLLIFASILPTGRTGLIGAVFSIILFLLTLFGKSSFKYISINKIQFIYYSIWTVFIAILFIPLISTRFYNIIIEGVIPYAFEMFINFSKFGTFETVSTNILSQMYFSVPFSTLLLGDGRYIAESGVGYYMATDAGYMRHTLYYGVFSLFLYSFYIIVFRKTSNNVSELHTKSTRLFTLFLFLYYFIVQVKGDILLGGNMLIKILFLLYLSSFYIQHNREEQSPNFH